MRAVSGLLYGILFSFIFTSCQKDFPPENKPPVVNAGNDQAVVLSPATGDSLILTGTAADADGSVVSYLWIQVSGPGKALIYAPGSATTYVSSLVTGTYIFQLMATDNKGAVGVGTVTVAVTQNNIAHGSNLPPAVNAGSDTTFDLTHAAIDSIRIAGIATDVDGTVVSYLWSQVSGPNTAFIVNPGAASTGVSGVISGKYVFQLMATDNDGATGVKTVTITVINPQVITVILQSQSSIADLHLAVNYNGNASDPMAPEIGATAWTFGGSPAYQRGLLKFDMSALPANAQITAAKLTLYSNPTPLNGDLVHANYGTNNAMLIQRVVSSWNSSTTWQTQPASETTGEVLIPHTDVSFLDLIDVDVTAMINRMEQVGNYGFLIKLQSETLYNSRIFCSSKFNDASKYPKLVVQYKK